MRNRVRRSWIRYRVERRGDERRNRRRVRGWVRVPPGGRRDSAWQDGGRSAQALVTRGPAIPINTLRREVVAVMAASRSFVLTPRRGRRDRQMRFRGHRIIAQTPTAEPQNRTPPVRGQAADVTPKPLRRNRRERGRRRWPIAPTPSRQTNRRCPEGIGRGQEPLGLQRRPVRRPILMRFASIGLAPRALAVQDVIAASRPGRYRTESPHQHGQTGRQTEARQADIAGPRAGVASVDDGVRCHGMGRGQETFDPQAKRFRHSFSRSESTGATGGVNHFQASTS